MVLIYGYLQQYQRIDYRLETIISNEGLCYKCIVILYIINLIGQGCPYYRYDCCPL